MSANYDELDYWHMADYQKEHGYMAMLKEFRPDEYLELLEEREAERLEALKEAERLEALKPQYPAFVKFINGVVFIAYAFIQWGLNFFAIYELWDIIFDDGLFNVYTNQSCWEMLGWITLISLSLTFIQWVVVSIWRNTWITRK